MHHLVLIGAGHAHARVLRDWAQTTLELRPPAIRLTLVTPHELAPYSGMVPGWLAGHFAWEACCVNFRYLCQQAGAELRLGEVTRLDAERQQLTLQDGTPLAYDTLSLNIGSTLSPQTDGSVPLLPLRPLAELQRGWQNMQQQIRTLPADTEWHMLVLGGGPAGVESILSAQYRLAQIAPHVKLHWTLLTRGQEILPGMARGAASRLLRLLRQRQIRVEHGFAASMIANGEVHAEGDRHIRADGVLWATGAQAHRWPQQSTLALDARGFIRIDAQLRSISHPNVFAVGDCCSWGNGDQEPASDEAARKALHTAQLPKAGVFAVRMGPVLSHNLQARLRQIGRNTPALQNSEVQTPALQNPALQAYAPQRHYLVLIGTGDAHALANRGPFSWQGRWVWRWKNRIDRGFLAQFNPPPPL